jgi:hypothetical protein
MPAPTTATPTVDPAVMLAFQTELNRQMAAARTEYEQQMREANAAHAQQIAELRNQLQQQQQAQPQQVQPQQVHQEQQNRPPTPQRQNRLDPDYNQKQQLKALSLTTFEGELDHKLVITFIQKVRLAGTVMRLRPASSPADSNLLIEYATGWFSDEPMNWLQLVVLEENYNITYDDARVDGFPFTFDEFAEMMVHRFSPTGATEDLWTELEKMQRKNYTTAYAFHHAFLGIAKMLGVYRQTEQKGGRAFALYVKKLTTREETIYQSMMATLHRERKVMFLDDLMTIVENAESNRPNIPSISTATPASSTTSAVLTTPTATTEPTPMELDAVSIRGRGRGRGQGQDREKCYKCGGYGHHSYQCSTPDEYKPGGGLPTRGRGRGAYDGRGRGGYGGYGGRGGYNGRGRGGNIQANQLEDGNKEKMEKKTTAKEAGGRIIGEVRDGKLYALEHEQSDF